MANVLIITTSHTMMGNRRTGLWLEEFAVPYQLWKQDGVQMQVCSIEGGDVPIDIRSLSSLNTEAHAEALEALCDTPSYTQVDWDAFDVVFFPGGHGPMFDMPQDIELQRRIAQFYEQGKIVAAICHGPAALVNAKLSNDKFLVDGHKLTCFSNEEEQQQGLEQSVPFMLETRLKEHGAVYMKAEKAFGPCVVEDGRLITGQNPMSAAGIAKTISRLLRNANDAAA